MAVALFIKDIDLKRNTIINGNVDVDKFKPYIKIAQEIHIQNYLGTDLYERLQAGIIAADLTALEVTLIEHVQPALIHFAMAEYLPFSVFQVSNGGVFKHASETSSVADMSDVQRLAQKERDFAEYYTTRLVKFLKVNQNDYPEYTSNTDDDIKPDSTVDYTGGWVL